MNRSPIDLPLKPLNSQACQSFAMHPTCTTYEGWSSEESPGHGNESIKVPSMSNTMPDIDI